jgi:hypothetical protein
MELPDLYTLRDRLVLPPLLLELIEATRWQHPGDNIMQAKIPFIRDPLIFLESKDEMLRESGPLMGPNGIESMLFSEYRGSIVPPRPLPWLDVEKSIFIICNKRPGDDVGIALDYPTGLEKPRVVGGDWHSGSGLVFREISPTFDDFVNLLEI